MQYKALIKDNLVLNVIVLPNDWTGEGALDWQPPGGVSVVNREGPDGRSAAPGKTIDGDGNFVEPEPPAPVIDARDAKIAALEGAIKALVDNNIIAVEKLPEDMQDVVTAASVRQP